MKLFSRLWLSLRSVCLPVMAEEAPPIIVYILTGFISKLLQKKSPAPSLPFIWFTFIYFQHWASSLPPGDIITNLKLFLSTFRILFPFYVVGPGMVNWTFYCILLHITDTTWSMNKTRIFLTLLANNLLSPQLEYHLFQAARMKNNTNLKSLQQRNGIFYRNVKGARIFFFLGLHFLAILSLW